MSSALSMEVTLLFSVSHSHNTRLIWPASRLQPRANASTWCRSFGSRVFRGYKMVHGAAGQHVTGVLGNLPGSPRGVREHPPHHLDELLLGLGVEHKSTIIAVGLRGCRHSRPPFRNPSTAWLNL